MQKTSTLWDDIVSGDYDTEVRLLIAGNPVTADDIQSLKKSLHLFPNSSPIVGNAVCGMLTTEFLVPDFLIPRMAEIVPQVRVTDGSRYSEWLDKGHFFIDTRPRNRIEDLETLQVTAYDAMLKTEADCPVFNIDYPAKDIVMLRSIALAIGVAVEPSTVAKINKQYTIDLRTGYSMREILSAIAAMYGGTFIINDSGRLQLVCITDIPPQTHYLVDERGRPITIGGVRIIV